MAAKSKRGRNQAPAARNEEKPATLKDLLNPDVLEKLKEASASLKADEADKREQERLAREEAKKAEQKRLDNDFEHLLNNSGMDWHKYK
ncbi:YqkE family protein [Paenibacillus lemnae]|uniref:YqkE family protein n=1 Tax=Paenibacillus lemnae TaxID=1330551 RepID=A0A848MC86_PAELE|nr:YqkE family protein [Paenibacillus lemnae]NMO97791.1 YqkE family protein [Paenibacillus lemnae]